MVVEHETTAPPRQMTAGRAVVEVLKAEGVSAIFGIPGGHVLDIYYPDDPAARL
jgi:acetolactate synthase-1/2/3 large subunit